MTATSLDLTGVVCPLNWVRTKLALERMAPGEELQVLLGSEEALENVPRSAREAGHAVRVDGGELTIRKDGGPDALQDPCAVPSSS